MQRVLTALLTALVTALLATGTGCATTAKDGTQSSAPARDSMRGGGGGY
ncbi:hypothetical protein GPA27_09900 [Aromatoleum toluolicum]|uniref:Uncharacterized protein n=1 Tax=Aromatoleum toluolicum TaxID=90060 RepID=A0ABX1NEV5_9RHOO|nr:hypothetical protein [Aromatoleum toluolicum]NMF97700.1 hypothetical protein [Aromatoleum toluolicum]